MAIAIHPYVTGAAHRIRYLRETLEYLNRHAGVVYWNGDQIYRWFVSQTPAP